MDQNLSAHLFWDIDKSSFDIQKHRRWLIERVIGYGGLTDWRFIRSFYGNDILREEVVQIRTMKKKDLNFVSKMLQIPITDFRCYTETQSKTPHWNY
jgi:hypothetical protein